MAVQTTTTTTIDNVEYISCWWGNLEFRTGDHTIKIDLTDGQIAELAEKLTKRTAEIKEKAAKKAKELLDAEETSDTIEL